MKQPAALIAAVLALVGCDQMANEQASPKDGQREDRRVAPQAPVTPPGTGPDARTPFGPAKPAADPKSPEAAEQVVRNYGALIEQDRWAGAATYWGDIEAASTFAKELQSLGLTHLHIGKRGEAEGAAGSIYVTLSVTFSGKDTKWGPSGRHADVILRRVNDVPGSTAAQRRWHIERIEWRPMA